MNRLGAAHVSKAWTPGEQGWMNARQQAAYETAVGLLRANFPGYALGVQQGPQGRTSGGGSIPLVKIIAENIADMVKTPPKPPGAMEGGGN